MTIIPYFRKSVKIKSKPWADPQCYIPKDDGIPSCLSLCNTISVEWDVHSSPWQRHLRCQTHNWERVPHSPYFMKTSHQPPPPPHAHYIVFSHLSYFVQPFIKFCYKDLVLDFLLFDKDEYTHGTFQSVILVRIFVLRA